MDGVAWAVVGVSVVRRLVTLALLVSLIGCQSLQGVKEEGVALPAGAGGRSVLDGSPYVHDVPGNFVVKEHEDICAVVMGWAGPLLGNEGFRLEPPVEGVYGGTVGGISVSLHDGGRYLSWSVPTDPFVIDMNAIVVKGGDGYRVYAYRRRSDETDFGFPHEDVWLRAPTNRGGKVPEIGHVTFCYWDEAATWFPDVVWGRQLWAYSGAGAVGVRDDGLIGVAGETYDPDTDVSDGYVAFFEPEGALIHHWPFGTDAIDSVHEVEFTADGHLMVVGTTHGHLLPEFGGAHAGGADVFVIKIHPDDGVVWFRQYGTEHDERGHGVSVDGNGDVLVIGDGGADDERIAMHLTRFDTDGTLVWSVGLALPEARVSGIGVVALDRNAYVVGTTTGDLADVGDDGARHLGARHGGYDPYVAKFQPSGALVWTYQFGTEADDAGRAVAVCNAGHLRVAGMTLGELTADRVNPGGADLFVLRVNHEGQEEWRVQFGSDADDHLHVTRHVMVPGMPDGHTVLVGTTYGDFAHADAHAGEADVFVVRLDHDGSELWRRQFGRQLWDFGAAVAYSPDDTLVVVAGSESHMITHDAAQPGYNSVIMKMLP